MRPEPVLTGALDVPTGVSPTPSSSVMPDGMGPHPVWHSPVPYLFGGLAAMLGMIVLALLVLACSYWRLSGYLNSVAAATGEQNSSGAGNGGNKSSADGEAKMMQSIREHVVVIMAGDQEPTFLATEANKKDDNCSSSSSSSSSITDNNNNNNNNKNNDEELDFERR